MNGDACDVVRLAYHFGLALRQALLESRSGFPRCLSSQPRKSVRLSMQHKRFDDSVNFRSLAFTRSPPSSSRLVLHKLCNVESLHQAGCYVILKPKSQPAGIWFCSRHGFNWPAAPPSQLWKGSHWFLHQQRLTRVHKVYKTKKVTARQRAPEGAKQS